MWLGLLVRKQEISEKTILKNVKTSQFYRAPLCAQMSVSADKKARDEKVLCHYHRPFEAYFHFSFLQVPESGKGRRITSFLLCLMKCGHRAICPLFRQGGT